MNILRMLLTLDAAVTSFGSDRTQVVSGTTGATVVRLSALHGTVKLQCNASTSLQIKVYVSLDGGVTFTPVVSSSGGSSNTAAGVAIVMSATTDAATMVVFDCADATHVKITREAGSGTVEFVATPLSGIVGAAGAYAILTALGLQEDAVHVSGDYGIQMLSVRKDTPVALAGAAGDYQPLITDANGALGVGLLTLLAGEDLTTNRLLTEQRFSYSSPVVVDTQVKSGAGFLHSVTISCNDAAPTAGSLIIYDNTAESGTQIFNCTFTTTPFAPLSLRFDVSFATGLYLGFATTGDVNVSVAYR